MIFPANTNFAVINKSAMLFNTTFFRKHGLINIDIKDLFTYMGMVIPFSINNISSSGNLRNYELAGHLIIILNKLKKYKDQKKIQSFYSVLEDWLYDGETIVKISTDKDQEVVLYNPFSNTIVELGYRVQLDGKFSFKDVSLNELGSSIKIFKKHDNIPITGGFSWRGFFDNFDPKMNSFTDFSTLFNTIVDEAGSFKDLRASLRNCGINGNIQYVKGQTMQKMMAEHERESHYTMLSIIADRIDAYIDSDARVLFVNIMTGEA
jgi:hypothetical protein